MYRMRASFLALRGAALLLQSGWRARVQRLAYAVACRRKGAALTLQRCWRGYSARKRWGREGQCAFVEIR